MVARFQRGNRNGRVGLVGRKYIHHIQLHILKHFFVIGVDLRVLCAVFLRGFVGAFLYDVTKRDHVRLTRLRQIGHVLPVGDSAAADNTRL
jgi:hypothetical protein